MSLIQISALMGQWIGIGCVIFGIFFEKKYKAHWGFVAITTGSLIFAIATKMLGF